MQGVTDGIVLFIFKCKGELKGKGIRPRKWRKIIGHRFVDSGEAKMYGPKASDLFCQTWDKLHEAGLI